MSDSWDFLKELINKRIRIVQKDSFIKSGILENYNDELLFLIFNDGTKVAISLENIVEVREVGE